MTDVFVREFIRLASDKNNVVLFNEETVSITANEKNGSISFKRARDKEYITSTLLNIDYKQDGRWIVEFDDGIGKIEVSIYEKKPAAPIDAITKRAEIAEFLNYMNDYHAAIVDKQLYCIFPRTKKSSPLPSTILKAVNTEDEIELNVDEVEKFEKKENKAYIETGSAIMNVEILEQNEMEVLKSKLFA